MSSLAPVHNPAKPQVDTTGLTGDEKVLRIALDRFKQCLTAEEKLRAEMLEDLYFFNGQQWLESILKDRADDRRPALTINKLPTYANQVINDMRQNRPTGKARPVDNVSDPDKADVINGILRNIANNGDSKNALDTASFYQVVCGRGFFRLLTRYCNSESFDQELYWDRVENPFSVYTPIHLIQRMDYSDMPYCFIRSRISKDEFFELSPKGDMSSYEQQGTGDPNWQGEDYIYIAEYFERICKRETLYLFVDGSTSTTKPDDESLIENSREVLTYSVKWRKITEFEVLEEKDFPGEYIPIIPVLGQEVNINGNKTYISLIRFAKDPQRMYNYWHSAFTEQIALAPRAPFVAAQTQIEGYEKYWQTANTKNHAYLPYKPVTEAGTLLPPPQRMAPPQAGSSLVQGLEIAGQQMKETTGIYDASLGSKGNETSGRAIVARQRQGDTANFHFIDNQSMAIKHATRIMIDIIPQIYDTARIVRIVGEDQTDKIVTINSQSQDGKFYDLTTGKYDVVVDVGPNYETKRVETAETLANLVQANPQMFAPVGDILVRSLDFPMSNEAADRMKRLLNIQFPGVIEDKDQAGGPPTEEEVRAIVGDLQKLQQQQQMTQAENDQLKQILGNMEQQLKNKQEETQIKADAMVIKAQSEVAKAKLSLQETAMAHNVEMNKHAVDTALELHKIRSAEKQNEQNAKLKAAAGPFPAQKSPSKGE